MKNTTQQEKQNDVIAKSIILFSLGDSVFNRVFSYKNAKELCKTINENHEGTKDVANERYHVLIDKLNSFKQLDDEDAQIIYSRLNILVNEITDLIRNILHSLRRPNYDLVSTITYEKELNT